MIEIKIIKNIIIEQINIKLIMQRDLGLGLVQGKILTIKIFQFQKSIKIIQKQEINIKEIDIYQNPTLKV